MRTVNEGNFNYFVQMITYLVLWFSVETKTKIKIKDSFLLFDFQRPTVKVAYRYVFRY